MASKTCTNCLVIKALEDFSSDPRAKDLRQSTCRKCYSKIAKEKRLKNPEVFRKKDREKYKNNKDKFRDYQLRKKYGITLAEKKALINNQNNKCYICKETFSEHKSKKSPCVDHNHKTLKNRKILCSSCNSALGYISENFETALNLAKYIQEDQGII